MRKGQEPRICLAKLDPFEPDLGPKIRVESGWVGPQDRRTGPIGSGWPQIWLQP